MRIGGVVILEQRHDLISRYFNLYEALKRNTRRLEDLKASYYGQSLTTRTTVTNEGELVTVGFSIEHEVSDYLDATAEIRKRRELIQKKIRYFTDYLNTLTPADRAYLFSRYVDGLEVIVNERIEQDTLDEIREIEDAISYMAGEEPEKRLSIRAGEQLSFNDMLEVLEV